MPQARRLGLVQAHDLTLADWPLRTSLDWQDSHFIPFDFGYFAFIYDSRKVTKPATSLDALINSDASIIYQDPRTSTPGQGLMHWMQVVYGDEAEQAWQRLAANTVTVTKGWSEAYGMFLQGEADYVLSYSTSPAYHQLVEETHAYQATRFDEGHTAQVEVAAVSAYSDEPNWHRRFWFFC
ncbi:thiamine ABC transporter substrate-binding protein [Nitrincola sp. A-D6]|uniref:thiamine ABC transporter substrate-binding protein n=1 Tax=Nitrincola sp. A-D6 TaxID=1545442 RepID=UPI000AE48114|nr:thiamine ABC transporter substrate-binding protein [Nitrincola sp. A-D6]